MSSEMKADKPVRSLHSGRHDDDLYAELAANPELARVAFLLNAAADERELAGLNAAIHDFRAHVSAPLPKTRRRPSMISTLAGAKLGAAVAAIAVGTGGVAAAAYVATSTSSKADHAPAAQSTTHPTSAATTKATAEAKSGKSDATPVGPDATGSAAYGLCTSWKGAADNGKAMESVAKTNLIEAAGGEAKVEAFCAAVPAPGKAAEHKRTEAGKPTDPGKPTDAPGKPTDAGKPTTVPTPTATKPTGKP